MSLSSMCARRPVAVAMLGLAVVLLGVISYTRLPIDLLPDVSFPRLVVHTAYPDVAPAEVERLVTEPIEAQAAAVPGVEKVSSVSQEGVSLVTLRFAWGADMDFATLNVRERLDNIRQTLPESAARPNILRVDPQAEPIMTVSIARADATGASAATEQDDLLRNKEIAETIFRRRLEQLDGVAQASVTGGLDREIHVDADPVLMETYNVSFDEIVNGLDRANYSSPGGSVLRGRYRFPLRTLGEFQSVGEIRDVVVARRGGRRGGEGAGSTPPGAQPGQGAAPSPYHLVRLSDVATVVDGFAEREAIAHYDGLESVGMLVYKEPNANTVAVSEEVQATLDLLAEQYPEFAVEVASNQATFISDSISNVVQALVLGGLLAFVVLFFFLRDPRYPAAVSLAIPVSVIATFALMDAFGVSLNIMSLGGLALGVGMLVDNSIIVLENIFRHRQAGLPLRAAAAKGAEEVQGAITAATLTTISVFGPIIYVQGVAGELFGALSLAVAFSLLASLLVALTLLPTMAGNFRGAETTAPQAPPPPASELRAGFWRRAAGALAWLLRLPFRTVGAILSVARQLLGFWAESARRALGAAFSPLFRAFDRAFDAFAAWYHSLLDRALNRRARVLGIAGAALAGSMLLASALETDLLPDVDQGVFSVRVDLPEGTALTATAELVGELERILLDDPGVDAVFSRIGRDVQTAGEQEDAAGVNTAVLQVRLGDGAKTETTLARVQERTGGFPAGALAFETGQATALGQLLGGTEADIAVRLFSEDLEAAYAFAEEVERRLGDGVPEVRNVRIGSERGQPQYQVSIDRDAAARYNREPRVVAEVISTSMRGRRATEFVDFDRKIPVVVRLPDSLRYDAATLGLLRVQGVPVDQLVDVRETVGPAEIRHEEQARLITVYADVASGGLGGAIAAVEAAMAELGTPAAVRVEVGGENEEMRQSFRDLAFAFGLALLLVYMILAAQFESFVHPFTILTAVPLALVGAILALALAGQGMNTMSLIGIVILVGIVVNDAIVKVDFINQARRRGTALRAAILEAGEVRLRPIVMTTVTTVLGLAPMALGIGRGADLRAPMAISVIGGLVVATALTLVVVPVTYSVMEDARALLPAGRRRRATAEAAPVPEPAA